MRAVSLSNDEVRRVLNDQFVCVSVNIKDDPAAGMSCAHPPGDGAMDLARGLGEHNNQILMLTPNGKILNALAGYVGSADLLEELQFSVNLLGKVNKASDANKEGEVAKAQKSFAEQFENRNKSGNNSFLGQFEQLGGSIMQIGARRAASDHRWTAAHALMPVKNFTTGSMVGNGKSFFAAQSSGTPPGMIGNFNPGNFFPDGNQFGNPGEQAQKMLEGFFGQSNNNSKPKNKQ
jgi:hypothetical protein